MLLFMTEFMLITTHPWIISRVDNILECALQDPATFIMVLVTVDLVRVD